MDDRDKISVVEDYCVVCKGKCKNTDPSEYQHMLVEWERLADQWMDRGATPSDVWSFLATILIHIARNNNVTWSEMEDTLRLAWQKLNEDEDV